MCGGSDLLLLLRLPGHRGTDALLLLHRLLLLNVCFHGRFQSQLCASALEKIGEKTRDLHAAHCAPY